MTQLLLMCAFSLASFVVVANRQSARSLAEARRVRRLYERR
jgi:hypothetical protein